MQLDLAMPTSASKLQVEKWCCCSCMQATKTQPGLGTADQSLDAFQTEPLDASTFAGRGGGPLQLCSKLLPDPLSIVVEEERSRHQSECNEAED